MAQGKMKVKAKPPSKVKNKNKKPGKGPAISKRANCPIVPKKKKTQEVYKLKNMVTKMVNKNLEEEMRSRAGDAKKNLSKVEQAVAAYHAKQKPAASSD